MASKKRTARKSAKKAPRTKKAPAARARSRKAPAGKAAAKKKSTRNKPKRKPAPPMDPDAMMAAWQRAATPAEGHRRLEPLVGRFRTVTTFVMAPGDQPQSSEGWSEHEWVLGGRYLRQAYKGSALGMPFEGLGYTGYDNVLRKYIGTWMDSFGTGLMHSIGVGKPRDEAIDFEAEAVEPTGETRKFWTKIRIADANRHSYEMWTQASNGRRFCMMKVEYSRA